MKKELGDGKNERKDREEAKERNKTKSNQWLSGPTVNRKNKTTQNKQNGENIEGLSDKIMRFLLKSK